MTIFGLAALLYDGVISEGQDSGCDWLQGDRSFGERKGTCDSELCLTWLWSFTESEVSTVLALTVLEPGVTVGKHLPWCSVLPLWPTDFIWQRLQSPQLCVPFFFFFWEDIAGCDINGVYGEATVAKLGHTWVYILSNCDVCVLEVIKLMYKIIKRTFLEQEPIRQEWQMNKQVWTWKKEH